MLDGGRRDSTERAFLKNKQTKNRPRCSLTLSIVTYRCFFPLLCGVLKQAKEKKIDHLLGGISKARCIHLIIDEKSKQEKKKQAAGFASLSFACTCAKCRMF